MNISVEKCIQNKFEEQYFGFSSSELVFEFCKLCEEHINHVCNDLKTTLMEKNQDVTEELATQQLNKLRKVFLSKIQMPLKEIKDQLENIFTIPEDLKIPPNTNIEKNIELQKLVKQLNDVKHRYILEKYFKERVKMEKDKLENILNTLQIKEIVKKVEKLPKKDGLNEVGHLHLEVEKKFDDIFT